MFLQILRSFECLATEIALVRFKRHMNSNVRCDVIAFYCGSAAVAPLTSKIEVVSGLATHVLLADMLLPIVV